MQRTTCLIMCRVSASQTETFRAPPSSRVSKHLIFAFTTVHWTKTHQPRLTADWTTAIASLPDVMRREWAKVEASCPCIWSKPKARVYSDGRHITDRKIHCIFLEDKLARTKLPGANVAPTLQVSASAILLLLIVQYWNATHWGGNNWQNANTKFR